MIDIQQIISEYNGSFVCYAGMSYVVLYQPYSPPKPSALFLDSYYPAYQTVRSRKAELMSKLSEFEPTDCEVPYKMVLLADGCAEGKNNLCIHPSYGSLFTCEIFCLKQAKPPLPKPHSQNICGDCRACLDACPTKAISLKGFNRNICVRELQKQGYIANDRLAAICGNRVLGCNSCSIACPKNHGYSVCDGLDSYAFYEACIIGKKALSEYSYFLGKNYIRPAKLLSLCLNALDNVGDYSHCSQAEELLLYPDERVVNSAKRYLLHAKAVNFEWELKYLITKEDYFRCLSRGAPVRQINYYFVSDGDPFYSVRVREKNGLYEFTYKKKSFNGKGNNEHNTPVLVKALDDFISRGITKEQLFDLCGIVFDNGAHYVGFLSTNRIVYFDCGLRIEVDCNEYLGYTDYEVECEVSTDEEYARAEQYLQKEFSCSKGGNKTSRFLSKKRN